MRIVDEKMKIDMEQIKIAQFGEGNFLRAFIDWMMAPGTVAVIKPRPGKGLERLTDNGCRYSVCLQGQLDGQLVNTVEDIDSIGLAINPYDDFGAFEEIAQCPSLEFVVSNTTEAGIVFDDSCRLTDRPALSYPGKLVQLLYARYTHFNGDPAKGLTILPCELIFHNGKHLKECIDQYISLWELPAAFKNWVDSSCHIYNTLVDRIVPGGPDYYKVVAEPYHLWVIEGPQSLRQSLPLKRTDINLVLTDNENPYHLRKVTLLNGPHTAMSAVGHLAGLETVRECMLDPQVGPYVEKIMYQELMPTVDLPLSELESFAASIKDRFLNPFVKHQLTSIMLNNISKFVTRDLPSLRWHYAKSGTIVDGLSIALAANLICADKEESHADKLVEILADASVWGADLTVEMPGLKEKVQAYIEQIKKEGIRSLL